MKTFFLRPYTRACAAFWLLLPAGRCFAENGGQRISSAGSKRAQSDERAS